MDPELKDYLDGQFAKVDGQFATVDGQFAKVDGHVAELGGQVAELGGQVAELGGQFATLQGKISEARDENHQTRILVEKLNDKIDLVAEGVQTNTEFMHRQIEDTRQEREEIKTVLGASIRHVERRVSRHDDDIGQLNRRVGLLEATKA